MGYTLGTRKRNKKSLSAQPLKNNKKFDYSWVHQLHEISLSKIVCHHF
jgi:hypothetical protein